MAKKLEIGIVYHKHSYWWLAVGEDTLVTYLHGEFKECKPYSDYEVLRGATVADLCERWNISIELLDTLSEKYLQPEDCHSRNPSFRTEQRKDANRPSLQELYPFRVHPKARRFA